MLRIISLAPSNTEILYALGCGESTIAITKLCDYPPENVKNKIRIGTWTETEIEKIAELKPDLILTSYYFPEQLRHYAGPGEIFHLTPHTLEDVYQSIEELGGFLGKEAQARTIIQKMKENLENIKKCSDSHAQTLEVYCEEWWKPPMAAGNWVPEIVELCGGRCKFGLSGQPSSTVTNEQILLYNPDVIIAHWCGRAQRSDVESIKQRKNWNHLQAVRNEQVYRMNDSLLNRPGPRLVEGAEMMHNIIHTYLQNTTAVQKNVENRVAVSSSV